MKSRGLLSLVTYSEKRSNILILLQHKPRTMAEIKEHLEATSPEIVRQLKKLERNNLIYKEGKKYTLTAVGEIATRLYDQLAKTLKIFEKDMGFWSEHKIDALPEEFRLRIHELGDYKIVKGNLVEPFMPHKFFIKNLLKSKTIKGVSPIFHSEYPKLFQELANNRKDVSLIVTQEVYSKLIQEHQHELKKFLKYCKLNVCDDDIQVAFTVTEDFLSLGMFLKDGRYDPQHDLMSFGKFAINWGEDLFNYYEKRSKKVELQDF